MHMHRLSLSLCLGIEEPCVCGNQDPSSYRIYETKSGQILGKQCILCKKEWLAKACQTPDDSNHGEDTVDCSFDVTTPGEDLPSSTTDPVCDETTSNLFLRTPFELDDNTAAQIIGSRTKIDWKFELLIPGNHITWQRKWGYYHHAIIVNVTDYGIQVIHWTKIHSGQIEITKEFLTIDKIMDDDPDSLYRLDYPEEVEKSNDMTLVLARAFSRHGDRKYGLLKDNCESFATFCKTGCEKSHQVVWLECKMKEFLGEFGVTAVKTLMKGGCTFAASMAKEAVEAAMKQTASMISTAAQKAGHKIAETAIQEFAEMLAAAAAEVKGKLTEEAMKNLWQKVAAKATSSVNKVATKIADEAVENIITESGGKVFFAESMEKVGRASNWLGAGLVILLEGIFLVRDLRKLYPELTSGNQTRRVFIEEATRRSVEGISAASFTILFSLGPEIIGAIVGSSVGPWGTFLGGVLGGAIGCFVGKAVGTSAGGHIGRALAKKFQDDQAVKDVNELDPGDHVVLSGGGALHPRCHAIVVKHNGKNHINVIRNTYKEGVVEEWIEFKEPLYKVMYDTGDCKDAQKVILYARLKKFEGYRYSLPTYNCKTFARECKTKSVLI